MKHKILESKDKTKVVRIEDKSIVISDEQSFLDLFMTIAKIILQKTSFISAIKSQEIFCKN